MNKERIYFPNLNGLRFIAAFLVIIFHIEQIKSHSKIENYWDTIPFFKIIGKLSVIFFFVLSGFLITYLLILEERTNEHINIRKFYLRRILRIWPLYFLIIILAFFVIPNIHQLTWPGYGKDVIYANLIPKFLLYVIFLPNLAFSMFGLIPYAFHTWSIGTEEQFYLLWPVLLKYIKKQRIWLMLAIVAFYLIFAQILATHFSDILPYKKLITNFWSSFNIDCMAIGGIYAVLLIQKNKLIDFLLNNKLFYFTLFVVIILLAKGIRIPYIHNELYAVLFGIIILNFAVNDKIKISFENKVLNYLGTISYGLYMYHPIGIALALLISISINHTTNRVIYPLSLAITILIAGFSYKYFESFFLKFKKKNSNVISRYDAQT